MIVLLISTFLVGQSLTLSPVSVTYHTENSPHFAGKIADGTTIHPGIHLIYKADSFQGSGYIFRDSFGNTAAGLLAGYRYELTSFLDVGVVAGPYIRSKSFVSGDGLPGLTVSDNLEIVPIGLITTGIKIPLNKNLGVELNVGSNYVINNLSLGLRVDW